MTAPGRPQARPTPYNGGPMSGDRILDAASIATLARARQAGVRVNVLAREFGISRRTVYRWQSARIVTVTVDGWTAHFAIRPAGVNEAREGPVQISHWHREVEA